MPWRSAAVLLVQADGRYRDADAAALQAQQDLEDMKAQMAAMQAQQMQAQMAAAQAQQAAAAAPPPAPAAAAPAPDMIAQLQQLAQLKEAGVLSEEEFNAAKAKLLAG